MPLADDDFDSIFADTYRPLLRYAQRRVSSRALAESVVSETLLEVWAARTRRPKASLPWLYGVARGKIIEHDRRSGKTSLIAPSLSQLAADRPGSPFDRKVLVDALISLPWKEREAILLTSWEELSPAEVAIALGCRERKARTLLERATRLLHRRVVPGAVVPDILEEVRDVVTEY